MKSLTKTNLIEDRAIPMDAHTVTSDEGFDAEAAFLKAWKTEDADKPSDTGDEENKKKPEPAQEETNEDPEDATKPSEESEEGDEGKTEETTDDETKDDQKDKAKPPVDDESEVEFKVGDETHKVKVGELKRLAGQEKALTQKGMEVANIRKTLETQGAQHVAATEALLSKAQERLKPFENVDWVLAATKLSPEEYQALRASAGQANEDVQFLQNGLNGYMAQVQEARNRELVDQAKETLKELSDPTTGIKGFNKDLYADMRQFALGQGVPQPMMDQIVSAPALRLIHMAMMYDKGQKAAATAASKTTKVVKTPTKIVKAATATEASRTLTKDAPAKAMDRLKKTGKEDDAEAAFFERFTRGVAN